MGCNRSDGFSFLPVFIGPVHVAAFLAAMGDMNDAG